MDTRIIAIASFILISISTEVYSQNIEVKYDHYRYLNPQKKKFDHPNTPSTLYIYPDKIVLEVIYQGDKLYYNFNILEKSVREMGQGESQTNYRVKAVDDFGNSTIMQVAFLKGNAYRYADSLFAIVQADGSQMMYMNKKYY
jgi:hypothetical protein